MSKNTAGNLYTLNRRKIDRMIEKIDRRKNNGKSDIDNNDNSKINNAMSFAADGSRVWSF